MATSGRYEDSDGQPRIRFERTIPHPVGTVWTAITDPEQLEQWFPTSVEFSGLATGAPIAFRFAEDRYPPMSGEIRELSPPERLVFTWGDDELTFELDSRDGGAACRLAFSVALDAADKAARDGAGWEACLDALALVAAGGLPPRPMPASQWQAYYDEYRRQGLPAGAAIPE
jgi:uncharacterized protein YndB with AHSA1/START domain